MISAAGAVYRRLTMTSFDSMVTRATHCCSQSQITYSCSRTTMSTIRDFCSSRGCSTRGCSTRGRGQHKDARPTAPRVRSRVHPRHVTRAAGLTRCPCVCLSVWGFICCRRGRGWPRPGVAWCGPVAGEPGTTGPSRCGSAGPQSTSGSAPCPDYTTLTS